MKQPYKIIRVFDGRPMIFTSSESAQGLFESTKTFLLSPHCPPSNPDNGDGFTVTSWVTVPENDVLQRLDEFMCDQDPDKG